MSEVEQHQLVNGDRDYTMEEAFIEAKRCLNCPKPLCRTGCPIEQEIPQFIHELAQGNIGEASKYIANNSNLPSICGRVCPREKQCEGHCILNRANKPINIGKLERFVADFESTYALRKDKPVRKNKRKIAVIGSGPAGLTVAGDMAKVGYDVTVFERQSEPGGILLFGIPSFRLSKNIVRRELDRLKKLGVKFECNVTIGEDKNIDQLMHEEGYEAVFIGTGTHVPATLDLINGDAPGTIQAMALLTSVQLYENGVTPASDIPVVKGDRVVIIGAGNVAIDAARTSLRLGAESVTIAYRRGEENMPCNPSEYEEAKEEGIQFAFYHGPSEVIGDTQVEALKCELQTPLDEGKIKASGEFVLLPADKIIYAIGHKPNARLVGPGSGIIVNEQGYVETQEMPYGMTNREGVFAGGDVVHKPATVVLAMREAKKVAAGMINYCELLHLEEN